MKLRNKVALVTGAGQGIGKAITLTLASEGARVVANDTNMSSLEKLTEETREMGYEVMAFQADVSKRNEVQDYIEASVKKFGRIDILVNNAGILRTAPLHELSQEDWDMVIDVDLKGPFNCTQATAPHMMKNKYGKIINISSVAVTGVSGFGQAAYASAKGGVVSLTKASARELGPYGINVNAIAPGTILTDIFLTQISKEKMEAYIEKRKSQSVLGRIGSPDDVAKLALFLASDDSSFITGQIIYIDGGRCDKM